MTEYQEMAKRQRVWMLFILVFFIVLAMMMPQKALFIGLVLGGIISFYNLWLLQRKTNVQGEAAASIGKRKGLGMISRFAAAALGALLALRMELSLVGYIIGLMTAYPVIVIDYLWFNRK